MFEPFVSLDSLAVVSTIFRYLEQYHRNQDGRFSCTCDNVDDYDLFGGYRVDDGGDDDYGG